ncbi:MULTISPECIES: hypothetical protein [Jeotgalibacillus]|uniref:hypothetical protein n=1 Tax=Jeotgalibacillus TaxID=157226 RepID=UPI00141A904F|nr:MULTISPECIES: hypothetical protein [Jeotgalibacillus]
MTDRKKEEMKQEVPENSSMASDLEEMDQLGKQMDKMRTAKQLKNRESGTKQDEHE